MSLKDKAQNTQVTGFQALWKHLGGICASHFIKNGQDFQTKELYHLAMQFGV